MSKRFEPAIPDWLKKLEDKSDRVILTGGLFLVFLAGAVDYAVGWRMDILVLYILPIVAIAWLIGPKSGLSVAALAAALAVLASVAAGRPLESPLIPAVVFLSNLLIFASLAALSSGLRRTRYSRQQLRFSDALTGLPTSEVFYREAGRQVKTAVRYNRAVSLAYIGVDNFGGLNERYGHKTGDEVLVSISQTLSSNLRETDVVARLGGDEFGVLFPETSGADGAAAAAKLRDRLVEATDGWPISFSVGLVTCERTACSLHDLLHHAERLMKDVKRAGRNDVKAEVLESERPSEVLRS